VRASRGAGGGGGTLLDLGGRDPGAATAGGGTLPRWPPSCGASGTSSFGIFGSSTGPRGGAGTYSARRSGDGVALTPGGAGGASGCSERRLGGGGGPLLGLLSFAEWAPPGGGVPETALAMMLANLCPPRVLVVDEEWFLIE
jgi:hypothetical protein